MNNITKVSDITYEDLAAYTRLDELSQDDINTLNTLLLVAKTHICQYTGINVADLDNYPDFVIVVCILVQDMWDNRTMYVDNNNLNQTVRSIMDMHRVNLL